MNELPQLNKVSARYSQTGNTLGTTDEVEELTIDLEFQLNEEDGPFIVLRTEGWSLTDMSELEALVARTSSILNNGVQPDPSMALQ